MSSDNTKDKEITRRQFVTGSATAGAAGLLLGPGSAALLGASKPWLPNKWDYEADVVVIGMGFAGQNAAIASHDAGTKVLILEKAPEKHAGGNSSVSGGGLTIPTGVKEGTPYYHALAFGTSPKELCDFMAEALYKVPEQLNKLGIELIVTRSYEKAGADGTPLTGLRLLPGANNGKIYSIKPVKDAPPNFGAGKQLHMALDKCVKSREIPIHYETRAKHLMQDPVTKEIIGVIAEKQGKKIYLKAKRGAVLACGGYENNPEMMSYFNYPGIRIYPWGSPYNTGDGIKMVSEIGAPLWHTFSLEWAGHSIKAASEQAGVSVQMTLGGSYVFVNKYGKRFMNELKSMVHTKESLELTYFNNDRVEYPNQPFYAIFDESVQSRQRTGQQSGMTWNAVHRVYQWSEGSSAEIEKGWVSKGDTIKDLAAKMKIDPDGLQETVTKYNQYCSGKKDPDFNRRDNSLSALTTPPYYGMELALTLINTQGGPKHNTKAQTLDQDDKPIPRLYSPGEFGSFFGFLYPGGSNIPEAIAFGRIAGENAAAEKPRS
jgi:succinate dehydrogenase/fumarate reductase flavoprotein subunit